MILPVQLYTKLIEEIISVDKYRTLKECKGIQIQIKKTFF
jgi:hypothetical protein